ncbi:MAG: hypothetical protein COS41_05845 [Elusimicrobia bacterium CG03_land_8_20_14_0_80_50_18]|nr:MAG: hypothetical protein COS41_05845 [Elusimicrobia bacterium CG03_land_8_20_14_0_80_50_18]PIX15196.1 MAG: hypothetical protein COZ72_04110 [Elusimicrobia bacterium CG_4_8_14_3_um_filter_50_9]
MPQEAAGSMPFNLTTGTLTVDMFLNTSRETVTSALKSESICPREDLSLKIFTARANAKATLAGSVHPTTSLISLSSISL